MVLKKFGRAPASKTPLRSGAESLSGKVAFTEGVLW
jgi:hypothetical protein